MAAPELVDEPAGATTIEQIERSERVGFAVTRAWRYEGYEGGIEDSLILVNGQEIGGAYHCVDNPAATVGWGWNDGGLEGASWASWGPRGLSCGHPTREAAEQAQVREYATNPDLFDRQFAQDRAEREAEQARLDAETDARVAGLEAEERRQRLGDDEPGQTVWTLPAYHVLYAPMAEVDAVAAWFAENGVGYSVVATHEVRVEQRATRRVIVFETTARPYFIARSCRTVARVVTLTTDPPEITTPARPDLHELLEEHWPTRFPLIDFGQSSACGVCTQSVNAKRKSSTAPYDVVPWPCPDVEAAIQSGPSERAA